MLQPVIGLSNVEASRHALLPNMAKGFMQRGT
jgi:hypothetical protein